uniref:Uncharacterized protein n=1 Tax=Steinernema glaseri TaxID=37863 RepID=A0A1I8A4V9_9BILA
MLSPLKELIDLESQIRLHFEGLKVIIGENGGEQSFAWPEVHLPEARHGHGPKAATDTHDPRKYEQGDDRNVRRSDALCVQANRDGTVQLSPRRTLSTLLSRARSRLATFEAARCSRIAVVGGPKKRAFLRASEDCRATVAVPRSFAALRAERKIDGKTVSSAESLCLFCGSRKASSLRGMLHVDELLSEKPLWNRNIFYLASSSSFFL